MQVKYQAHRYDPDKVTARYVRRSSATGGYDWCEVGDDRRYDVRQGTVEPDELPDHIRAEADEAQKKHCHYITWPF